MFEMIILGCLTVLLSAAFVDTGGGHRSAARFADRIIALHGWARSTADELNYATRRQVELLDVEQDRH